MIKLLLILLISINCYAECDFSTIKKTNDGFLYPQDCHRLVGKLIQDNKDYKQQILEYDQLLKLSKDHIELEHQRAELWKTTSLNLKNRIDNISWSNKSSDYIHFGAGVLIMLGAGWVQGQIK